MKVSSRWWFYLAALAVALASAIFGPQPDDVVNLGSASAKDVSPRVAAPAQALDYFPDHYVNQAKAPAEPIDVF